MRPVVEDDNKINHQKGRHPSQSSPQPENKINHQKGRHPSQSSPQPEKKGVRKCFDSIIKWLADEDKDKCKWMEEMRGMLSLVATVISTMTFQAAINPPGGVNDESGQSILGYHPDPDLRKRYAAFTLHNTISFGASLGVTVLLVSGIPLKHSFPIWLLSIGMCITLTFLGLTYYSSIRLVNPPGGRVYEAAPWIWSIFIACIALILTIRFVIWLLYAPPTKMNTNTGTNTITKP